VTALARALAGVALAFVVGAAPAAAKDAAARGNPQAGQEIYTRCLACHALAYDRTGPRHCGLIGRRAGSVKGFAYSTAMQRSGIVWNEATLNRFLANPLKAVPGTSMGYAGIPDSKERADLIAYLGRANESSECRKLPRPPRAN
jgi:cytochrome c